MKFFVVKANLDELKKMNTVSLRPIQINFDSPKFMLPIRLGMANAGSSQDMIVYALSKTGRVETVNYPTLKMPTDNKVPEFTANVFGKFYQDLWKKNLKVKGMNNVFLEYAWDISMNQFVFCDPCTGTPPQIQDMMTAGVNWLQFSDKYNTYLGNVYFTRLHVTYDRKNFPQDLQFQETSNKENFQCRYVITHPAQGPFECKEGKQYLNDVYKRRVGELLELSMLTGWDVLPYSDYATTINGYKLPIEPTSPTSPNPPINTDDTSGKIQLPPDGHILTPDDPNSTGGNEGETTGEVDSSNFHPGYVKETPEEKTVAGSKYNIAALLAMGVVVLLIIAQRAKGLNKPPENT